jgi:hypothetical protein
MKQYKILDRHFTEGSNGLINAKILGKQYITHSFLNIRFLTGKNGWCCFFSENPIPYFFHCIFYK